MCVCMLSCFSRVWLCNPMDRNPSGSSVHEILQARVLEWLAMPFSMGSSSGSPALQASSPSEPLGKSLFSTASAKSNYWYHLTSDGWAVGIEKSFRKEQRWTRRNVNFTNLDPISVSRKTCWHNWSRGCRPCKREVFSPLGNYIQLRINVFTQNRFWVPHILENMLPCSACYWK